MFVLKLQFCRKQPTFKEFIMKLFNVVFKITEEHAKFFIV